MLDNATKCLQVLSKNSALDSGCRCFSSVYQLDSDTVAVIGSNDATPHIDFGSWGFCPWA